jgi:protein gp37
MQSTKIEYLTHTWNPFAMRCTPMSEGCANCWHLRMANRLRGYYRNMPAERTNCYAKFQAYRGGDPWLNTKELAAPFSVKKPAVIGVQFMGDLFHESLTDEQIAAEFGVMAATPQHQYVVLTKRLQRALKWYQWAGEQSSCSKWSEWVKAALDIGTENNISLRWQEVAPSKWDIPLNNVIMCASVEDQPTADERVPLLLQIPARWRGVSVEPMLGPVNMDDIVTIEEHWEIHRNALECDVDPEDDEDWHGATLDLVICGAETGPGKRPFRDEWALDLRDQCKAAGTPFYFKKDGSGNQTLCGVEYHEWVK